MAKWIVQKELLESTVSLIDNVPPKNGIKSSEFIKISSLKDNGASFSLTSDIAAKALLHTGEPYPFESDLFLDLRLFVPFVNKGKESKTTDYIFIEKGETIILKHGNRRAVYAKATAITGYEEPINLDKAKVTSIQKKWTSIVDCAENCATPDPTTPSLNCVYVSQKGKYITASSTNDRLIFVGKVETDKKPIDENIAFPLLLVKTLRTEGATKLYWTNKLALVQFPKGSVWQAVKTEARKNFPILDIKKYTKNMLLESAVISCQSNTFMKIVDRISSYVAPLAGDDLALEIHLTKGSKKISVIAGPEESRFTETFYGLEEAKKDVILEWPLTQVLPIILYAKEEGNIRFHIDKKGVSCFASDNLTLVISARST